MASEKLVLLNMDSTGGEGHPPLGLAYLASHLRKYMNFYDVGIVDKEKNTFKAIKKQDPSIVGISSVTCEFNKAIGLANKIKMELDVPVILGGHHIAPIPDTLPKCFDIAVIGEGEQTIMELMRIYDRYGHFSPEKLKKVQGIAFQNNGKVIVNKRRSLIQPLDFIPYPARDLLKMEEFYLTPRRTGVHKKLTRGTQIFTSRGCPFKCIFCSTTQFWQIVRYHSTEYVVNEVKMLIEKYKIKSLAILDDLFAADIGRLEKITKSFMEEGISDVVESRVQIRVDLMTEDRCKLLKKMGVAEVGLGFESGSQKVLNFLKKRTTLEQCKNAIKLSKKHGFTTHGYFMTGVPVETKEDMISTLNFIKNNPISTIDLAIATPLPGTELWDYAEKKGLVSKNMNWDDVHLKTAGVYLNEMMSKDEFFKMYSVMKNEVDRRNFTIKTEFSNLLSKNLLKRVMTNPIRAFKFLYYSFANRRI